jgi:ankyrin repeat protein
MLACSNGHQSTVQLLLDRKADINATNTYYRVFWAVFFCAVWCSVHYRALTVFAADLAGMRCLMLL